MNPFLHRALSWAALGVPVFPTRDKKPLIPGGFLGASVDPKQIEIWWATYRDAVPALHLDAAGLCAADLDDPAAIFERNDWGDTYTVQTPRGGHHLIYRGRIASSAKKIARNADTRGVGGYIVAYGDPPASLDAFALVPQWISDIVPVSAGKATRADNINIDVDAPNNVQAARAYLQSLANGRDKIIGSGERDNRTYQIACKLREMGVSRETSFELVRDTLLDHFEGADWTEDNLWPPIDHAFDYAQNQAGLLAKPDPIATFAPVADAIAAVREEEGDGYPAPKSAADLAIGNFPRAQHVWQDFILEKHVSLLYGDGGTGKTLLALHVGIAVAAGVPLFGRQTKQMPVLFVLAEDDDGETKARAEAICKMLGLTLADLPIEFWCLPGLDLNIAHISDDGTPMPGPFLKPLVDRLKNIDRPCLLVLDTVTDIATLDETKRPPPNTLIKKVLARFCREFGTTVVVNAHPSKAAMASGDGYAGATSWKNSVRNMLTLERVGDSGPKRKLKVKKANYGAEPEIELYLFGTTFMTSAQAGHGEAAERDAVFATVLGLIDQGVTVVQTHGNGQTPDEVAKEIGDKLGITLTGRQVRSHLMALERSGKLAYSKGSKTGPHRERAAGYRRPSDPADASSVPLA